jgi:hypothetical protein
LFIRDSDRYVKEGAAEGELSQYVPLWGTWNRARFIEDFEGQMKLVSGSGASLSIGDLSEPGGMVSLLGILKTT